MGRRVSAALLERGVPPHQPAHENRGESDGTTESPDGEGDEASDVSFEPPADHPCQYYAVSRPIIVRFSRERTRDRIFKARTNLKSTNNDARFRVNINEDLTKKRAELAKKCRELRKGQAINDWWSFAGNCCCC